MPLKKSQPSAKNGVANEQDKDAIKLGPVKSTGPVCLYGS
jgi:hypothetical protein